MLLVHGGFHFLGQSLALSDGLHRLERQLGLDALQDQVVHNIVSAADTAGQRNALADQLCGIAEPNVRAVRQAGNRNQLRERRWVRLLYHAAHELGAELGHRHTAEVTEDRVGIRVFARVLKRLARMEQAHGLRVVKRNLLRVHAGEVLQMLDNGRVIVSQLVELQEVRVNGVILEVGGNDLGIRVVRRMLNRTDVVNLNLLGHNDNAARMLTRGAAHARAACGKAVFLRAGALNAALLHVLFDITERGFFGNRADGARSEHMVVSEDLAGVPVNARLILARKVQVNIRHLVALKAEEGLERNVEALFGERLAAFRADLIGQIDTARVFLVPLEIFVVRTQIVRGERINLGDIRHERRERRADRTTRADQIAVREGLGNQLLRDNVHNRVAVADDGAKLTVKPRLHRLGQRIAVDTLGLFIAHVAQVVLTAVDVRRVVFPRHRTNHVTHVGDLIGVLHDYLIRPVLPEIGKFLQHFIRALKVQRRLIVRIGEALTRHQDTAERLILGFEEVYVTGGTARFSQFIRQAENIAVPVAQLLLVLRHALCDHKVVVADRLNLQIVVERRQPLDLLPRLALGQCAEYLARLTRRAENQSLTVTDEFAARHNGALVVIFQKALGNQLIQVSQSRLVLHQNDKMIARQVFQLVLAVGRRRQHRIDIRSRNRVHLLPEPFQQLDVNAAEHGGILARAVVLERADLQLLRQNVQLELVHVRQHQSAHLEGINACKLPLDTQSLAGRPQEAHIEACVVRHKRVLSLACPCEEFRHGFVEVGRVCYRLVRNAGQLGDFRRNRLVRVDIGLEGITNLALHNAHSSNLGNFLARRIESGGLKVEHDECSVERLCAPAAHDRNTVLVVDVVRLDAVDDLHVTDDVLLLALLRVQCFGERLRHTVVGNRHRAVSPLGGAAQQRRGAAHAVHRAHVGVQMQLHALHALVGVLALGLFRLDDAGRLEHHLLGKGVIHHLALHGAVQTLLDFRCRIARLVRRKELGNAHGIGAVGHIKRNLDVILAGFLAVDVLAVGEEHLALNGDHVIGGNRLVDRNNGVLNQLAENEVVLAHLLGARALIAGMLLRRRTRLFRLGRFRRGCRRLLHSLVQNFLAALLLLGCGCKILCVRAYCVHRTAAAQLPLNTRLQMPQCICEMLFAHLVHRDLERTVRERPLAVVEQTLG